MKTTVLILLLLMPALAYAEVSDKLPTISQLLVHAVLVATALCIFTWFRWWLVVLGLAVSVWFIGETIALWLEVPMREALLHEQGAPYFISAISADLLVLVGAIGGAFFGWRRQHAAQQSLAVDAPQAARH